MHVRSDSTKAVTQSAKRIIKCPAYVSPPANGWVSVYDEISDQQDTEHLTRAAMRLSKDLATTAIGFMVHDSDILLYWLYEAGELKDEFNSVPDYFGEPEGTETANAHHDPHALLRHCRPGTALEQLQSLLDVESPSPFAEQTLGSLAELLAIQEARAVLGFRMLDKEDSARPRDAGKFATLGRKAQRKRSPKSPVASMLDALPGGMGKDPWVRLKANEWSDLIPHDTYATAVSLAMNMAQVMPQTQAIASLLSGRNFAQLQQKQVRELLEPHLQASKYADVPTVEQLMDAAARGVTALAELTATRAPAALRDLAAVAVQLHQLPLLEAALLHGLAVDVPTASGRTLLHHACMAAAEPIVARLLERGADVNARAADGTTPLMSACIGGSLPIVQSLLTAGAQVSPTRQDGNAALSLAQSAAGSTANPSLAEIAELLQKHGAR
jgi:hypothetical protein